MKLLPILVPIIFTPTYLRPDNSVHCPAKFIRIGGGGGGGRGGGVLYP